MRRKQNNWNKYMAGAVGEKGYYIREVYGPFKTKEAAEFFNFIAFGSPRSLEAGSQSRDGIDYLHEINKPMHPRFMFMATSHFSVWWEDTFGVPLTVSMIMDLAKECKADGYKSFIDWLVSGSKLDGRAPHYQYSSTLT